MSANISQISHLKAKGSEAKDQYKRWLLVKEEWKIKWRESKTEAEYSMLSKKYVKATTRVNQWRARYMTLVDQLEDAVSARSSKSIIS